MDYKFEQLLLSEGTKKEKLLPVAIKRLTAHIAAGFPVSAASQLVAKTKEQAGKLDRCVEDVLSKRDFTPKKGRTRKEAAWAICTSQILGSRGFSQLAFLRQIAAETGAHLTPEMQAQEILKALRKPSSVEYRSYLTPDKKDLDRATIMEDLVKFHMMSADESKEVLRLLDQGWKSLKERAEELSKHMRTPPSGSSEEYHREVGRPAVVTMLMVDGVMIPSKIVIAESEEILFEEGV